MVQTHDVRHSVSNWFRLPASRGMQINCTETSRGSLPEYSQVARERSLQEEVEGVGLVCAGYDDAKRQFKGSLQLLEE